MLAIINKNKNLSYNIFNYENKKLNTYQIKIINNNLLINKKNILEKNKCKYEKYKLINIFYKNLLKEIKEYDKEIKIKYYSIELCNYDIINNNIIISTNITNITESEFPQINNYDRIEEKYIESYIFDKFDINFETQSDTILNIIIKNNNIIQEEINYINNILSS